MSRPLIVGDAAAALRELNQALNLSTSAADLRCQFLGYMANDAVDSVTLRLLQSTWAKIRYFLALFDQGTTQLYFDAYRCPIGHLLWTHIPAEIDAGTWLQAVPLPANPGPADPIFVISASARDGALRSIRADLEALSAKGRPVVYLRRRGRQVRLVEHAPHAGPLEQRPLEQLRGGAWDRPAMLEIARLRMTEGRLMQAFASLAAIDSPQHSGRIRIPMQLEQYGLARNPQGCADGVATWAWLAPAQARQFEADPYGASPAQWREGADLRIVDALGNWRGALDEAVAVGRLTEADRDHLIASPKPQRAAA